MAYSLLVLKAPLNTKQLTCVL